MPRVKIEKVRPGDVLVEDVIQDGRNILLNSGQVMEDRLIQMLKRRGITEIAVQQAPQKSEDEEKPVLAQQSNKGTSGPPSVTCFITHDQMAALVSVEPRGPNGGPVTSDLIKKALVDVGVVFGYLDQEIQNVLRRYNSTRDPIRNVQVARGRLASPGKQGELTVVVPHISNVEDYHRLTSAQYASEVPGIVKEGFRVDSGTIVAKRLDAQPSQQGMDVCGEEIETDELLDTPVNLGSNVEAIKEGSQFQAVETGIVCYIDKTLSVFPLCFDSKPELVISEDKMGALLTIHTPGERGLPPDEKDVLDLLEENKVSFGVREEAIRGAIKDAAAGIEQKDVVVAKGEPPVNGEDGRIEFLFDVSGRAKPKTNEDGTVDYKNIKLVENVEAGTELVRLVPPTTGKAGHDVFGEELPASDGAEAQLPIGNNTAPMEGNEGVLVATATGNVRYTGTVVEVSEGFNIKGDVDFSTGNIKYPKSVTIGGDIKSGFTVEAGGDVEVRGTVEDATIESGGSVLVRQGFIGSGKGLIVAKENVSIAFVRNQEIRSRQDIYIAREAIGAKLWAKNCIEVLGRPFSIAGGHISARNEIRVYTLGNENGTRTEVEVGIDFTLLEEQTKTEGKIKELNVSYKKVRDNLQKLRHVKQIRKVLQPKEEFLLKKLQAMEDKIKTQLDALEKRKQVIGQRLLEVGKARIAVEHAVYPGTVVKIRDRHMVVNREIVGPKSVIYSKGEIKAV